MRMILLLFLIYFNKIEKCDCVSHWIVTQTGKVQAYLETPFDLRWPYDLLALLDQETRWNDINDLYDDLMKRKEIIEKKWSNIEKNSNGLKASSQDSTCLEAGKLFSDIDLYGNIASNGSERNINIKIPNKIQNIASINEPLCSNFAKVNKKSATNLPTNKTNITLIKDDSLIKNFLPVDISLFGHIIHKELNRNSTSWLHYNLASIYWRIKGDGNKAIDCIKLAIQHATEKQYRDIPLYNLAGILHQARHTNEAAQILHTAVEIAPNQPMHYLALGNIYASKGEYNRSVVYYDEFLKFKPGREDIVANKQAILCYWKLEQSLMNFQGELQSILNDLHDYHSLQQQWLRLQQRLMWEHASFEYQYDNLNSDTTKGDTSKKIQRCIQKTSENSKKPVISCDFYDKGPDLDNLSLQNLFQFVENEKQKLSEQIGKATFDSGEYKHRMPPVLHPKFPLSMSTKENQYFDATGWPNKDECLNWNLPVDEKDDLNLPVFLPPENKGFQVKSILSTYIELSENSQHPLPWYPPVCENSNVNGEKYVPSNDRNAIDTEIKANEYLKNQLLKYVDDGKIDEAEIGQRIITAMEKKVAPRWVLATLASLYWRIRGNARKALDCLDMAFQIIPKDTTDMALVSLSSILYQMGFYEQSMKFASLAFKINYIEPSTNFLLSLLHYSNNNPLLAMYYMKNVLRVEPDFYEGKAEVLLKTWGCRIKMGSYSHYKKESGNKQEVCMENEFESEGVVCSKNGEHCKSATIQCYKKEKEEHPTKTTIKSDLCNSNMERVNLGQTIISSLLAAEGSGDIEPDQSRLVALNEHPQGFVGQQIHHHVHMRLSLGEEHPTLEHAGLGDFFVSVSLTDNPESENKLLVYDKYGSYTLSATECKNVKILHKFKYSSVWPSIVARSLDLSPFLKPIPPEQKGKDLKPFCIHVLNMPMPHNLDELTQTILSHRLPSSPERDLSELLGLMASNQKLSVKEMGARIAIALKEDETSWILLTAAGIFWRIVGNSEQAVICLRAALTQVKPDMMDIPLLHLANLLNRVGYHGDALDVANLALKTNHYFVLNHFTLANIHISTGEYEKAVAFFRACLSLDQNFEPARVRLKAVLCTLLFDENASTNANGARRVMEVID